jgi:hypothetical protein
VPTVAIVSFSFQSLQLSTDQFGRGKGASAPHDITAAQEVVGGAFRQQYRPRFFVGGGSGTEAQEDSVLNLFLKLLLNAPFRRRCSSVKPWPNRLKSE